MVYKYFCLHQRNPIPKKQKQCFTNATTNILFVRRGEKVNQQVLHISGFSFAKLWRVFICNNCSIISSQRFADVKKTKNKIKWYMVLVGANKVKLSWKVFLNQFKDSVTFQGRERKTWSKQKRKKERKEGKLWFDREYWHAGVESDKRTGIVIYWLSWMPFPQKGFLLLTKWMWCLRWCIQCLPLPCALHCLASNHLSFPQIWINGRETDERRTMERWMTVTQSSHSNSVTMSVQTQPGTAIDTPLPKWFLIQLKLCPCSPYSMINHLGFGLENLQPSPAAGSLSLTRVI